METVTNEIAQVEITDIVKSIDKSNALSFFKEEKGLEPILTKIESHVKSLVFDVNTKQGRKEIASLASKIAKSKTHIDNVGKELVDELKEIPRKIDAERKRSREFLDLLKDTTRKPLTEWEEKEEKRLKDIELKIEQIKSFGSKYDAQEREYNSQELKDRKKTLVAIVIDDSFGESKAKAENAKVIALERLESHIELKETQEKQAEEFERMKKEQEEKDRQLEEERKKREIAEKAQKDAEENERKAKEELDRKDREEKERAEREQKQKEENEKKRIAQLEKRVNDLKKYQELNSSLPSITLKERLQELLDLGELDDSWQEFRTQGQASLSASIIHVRKQIESALSREDNEKKEQEEKTREAERKKIEAENQKKKEEENKRQADLAHRNKIKGEIVNQITLLTSIDEDLAKALIDVIEIGEIKNLQINF